ncbi:hypothetical protein [Massilia phyllosphaerae]|uniref:hypothetical protein n=1 Tax=Massilia phyllosphaerae TaxID=3106034 RepID=UPI002B1CCB10|nr:hypothetical protein [Massilia sp. SGZ-792]
MKRRRVVELVWCLPLCALLCVATIAVVLFRLFSVTFFWTTTSAWAVVPALVIIALLFVGGLTRAARRYAAAALVVCYLGSVYFDGWRTIVTRIADGGNAWFEGTETAIILFFALLHQIPNGRLNDPAT